MAIPVFATTLAVIIGLFVLQVARRALANSQSSVAMGIEGALSFLLGG